MKKLHLLLAGFVVLSLLAACAAPAPAGEGPHTAPVNVAASTFQCPVTAAFRAEPANDPNADPFGDGPWFISADRSIWMPTYLNAGGNKLVWIRPAGTTGHITGQRLDAEAAPLEYTSPGGASYQTGFEVGGLTFPTEGCWEVTAQAGKSSLTFVTEIGSEVKVAAPPKLFFTRPTGERGPLVAYDVVNGTEQFRLPAGLLSADGQRFLAAEAGQATLYDARFGHQLNTFEIGDWELSALSPTGARAVLWQLGTATYKDGKQQTTTSIKILNTANGVPQHELHLDGHFEVDALAVNGQSLFLIERLSGTQADQYVIRLYDLSKESLLADPIRSKGADEIMAGYAWGGVGTPNGEWLLTLYVSTLCNVAFVHALNLNNGFAICILLPSGAGEFEKLKQYSLTLAPDGQRLYAANTALGTVAEIALVLNESVPAVTRQAQFPAQAESAGRNLSALTEDGRKLYFSNGVDVWAYATETGAVLNPFRVAGPIEGLGVSADGRRLFVMQNGERLMLDTLSAQVIP